MCYQTIMLRWFAAVLIAPTLAWAGDEVAKAPGEFVPMDGVEYYCTDASGRRVELGQIICITAGCQTWMAKCDMSVNVTTWRKTQDGCLAASLMDRLKAFKPSV